MSRLISPHSHYFESMRAKALEQSGALDLELRRKAMAGESISPAIDAYRDLVREKAARIEDEDIDRLRAEGLTEDQIFELSVCLAIGAAGTRLAAGLRAVHLKKGSSDAP